MTTSVGVVGFRGYSGSELLGILERHAHVQPILLEHRSESADAIAPRGAKGPPQIPCTFDATREAGIKIVFLATAPEVSLNLTAGMLQAGVKVIDLSGAFRLRTTENYQRWYKAEHTEPELLAEAVYGLPEFYRDTIKTARLVSNPGCYPTAANLALKPLIDAGLIDLSAGVVCDAKSGVSGAGRKPSLKTSFCEVAENFSAYSLLDHRHVPEVLQNSGLQEHQFSFTAQLLPIDRGILETIYFRASRPTTGDEIVSTFEAFYRGTPFVRFYDPGVIPDLRAVQHTNFCDIGVKFDASTGRGVLVSVIDNLVKGAAGQAVQNMNLLLGLPEHEGLL